MRVTLLALLTALSACAADLQPAAPSSEALRGRAYAEEVCAACHAIEPGARYSPNPLAPTFQDIADTPGMTRIALSAWIQGSHENMPQLIVDQDHIDDLWAYLDSIEQR